MRMNPESVKMREEWILIKGTFSTFNWRQLNETHLTLPWNIESDSAGQEIRYFYGTWRIITVFSNIRSWTYQPVESISVLTHFSMI
jgi:hypothetical protein